MNIIVKIKLKFASPRQRAELYREYGYCLGNNCEVYPGVKFGTEPYLITIGNNVRITSNVRFITHDGGVWVIRNMNNMPEIDKFGTISIGNNVMIGTDSIIMPNSRIGNNCIIGAGTVVTKEIPDNSVVAGVPGKIICTIEEYYRKNKDVFLNTKGLDKAAKQKILISYFK